MVNLNFYDRGGNASLSDTSTLAHDTYILFVVLCLNTCVAEVFRDINCEYIRTREFEANALNLPEEFYDSKRDTLLISTVDGFRRDIRG